MNFIIFFALSYPGAAFPANIIVLGTTLAFYA
jgi:hypothetical protein